MHIAVAGNIGSGKTTLTTMLAKHYGWKPQFESVINNPYLEDYYKDIQRWSLNLEIYFLKERFKDMLELKKSDEDIIQDRSIFEGVYVFAYNNKEQGNMSEIDFKIYMDLFHLMMSFTKEPDLMIYLRASVPHLVSHIQMRGRDYEQSISLDYLQGLNERYDDFIYHHYKGRVLTIEVDNLDFLHRPADFESITNRIDSLLFGLFQ
jgi:deoxyadenosine/deoxycytidine kinase